MRRAIIHAALIAAVVLLPATDATAQQAPAMIATAATAPNGPITAAWTAPPHPMPQIPATPGAVAAKFEAPGGEPPNLGGESSEVAEVATGDDGESRAVMAEALFLLPVWHHGFWAMPPGGMTRYIFLSPVPVDPDSTLAADPVMVSSGCSSLP